MQERPFLTTAQGLFSSVCVAAALGTVQAAPPKADTSIASRILNLSTNGFVGANGMAGGFIISGTQPKRFILMGEDAGGLSDPTLRLTDLSGSTVFAENDNWQQDPSANEIMTSLRAPSTQNSAAFAITLSPGTYIAHLEGVNGSTGRGLLSATEIQDDTNPTHLLNVSTNTFVDNTGTIAGFIVVGSGPKEFVVMGENAGGLGDAKLEVTDLAGNIVYAQNDDWQAGDTANEITSTLRSPGSNSDAASAVALAPGAYLAHLTGANGGTGQGIVSVTEVNGTLGGGTPHNAATMFGAVPGTLIEAFGDNGSYFATESTDNGTPDHPFSLDVPSGIGFRLVMTVNDGTPDAVVQPIGFRDSTGALRTRLVPGAGDMIDFGTVPLSTSRSQIASNDLNQDGILDTPFVLDDADGARNPLRSTDADKDGMDDFNDPDHGGRDFANGVMDPLDADGDGIPNPIDPDYNVPSGVQDDDRDGLPNASDISPHQFNQAQAGGNAFFRDDMNRDGFHDDDLNRDGFHDGDLNRNGNRDDNGPGDNSPGGSGPNGGGFNG